MATNRNNNFNFLIAMLKHSEIRREVFRLIVDGKFHQSEKGFVGYENREKHSVFNGLNTVLETQLRLDKNKPIQLTIKDYKKIHASCRDRIAEIRPEFVGGQFADKDEGFFGIRKLTVDGLKDLCDFAKKYPQIKFSVSVLTTPIDVEVLPLTPENAVYFLEKMANHLDGVNEVHFACQVSSDAKNSEEIVEAILNECNRALSVANSDAAIIEAIVTCAYELEHLHPFSDVNLRSHMVLINLVLDYYDLPPVSYFDPNYIHGSSKLEFCEIVKMGMLQTIDFIQNPGEEYFGFKVSELTPEENRQYLSIVDPLFSRVANLPFSEIDSVDMNALIKRIELIETHPQSKLLLEQAKLKKSAIYELCNDYHQKGIHAPLRIGKPSPYSNNSMFNSNGATSAPVNKKQKAGLAKQDGEIIMIYIDEFKRLAELNRAGRMSDTDLEMTLRQFGDATKEVVTGLGVTIADIATLVKIPRNIIDRLIRPSPGFFN